MTWPKSSTTTWSDTRMTSPMWCSTISSVSPRSCVSPFSSAASSSTSPWLRPDAPQRLVGVGGHRALLADDHRVVQGRGQEAGAMAMVGAEHHVLAHAQRGHERQVLERARDAERGDLVCAALQQLRAVEADRA